MFCKSFKLYGYGSLFKLSPLIYVVVHSFSEAIITIDKGTFDELTFMRVEKWDPELGDEHIKDEGGEMDVS